MDSTVIVGALGVFSAGVASFFTWKAATRKIQQEEDLNDSKTRFDYEKERNADQALVRVEEIRASTDFRSSLVTRVQLLEAEVRVILEDRAKQAAKLAAAEVEKHYLVLEMEGLKKDNIRLFAENQKMCESIAALHAQNSQLLQENRDLRVNICTLQEILQKMYVELIPGEIEPKEQVN